MRWPGQQQIVTSLTLHGKELPWRVFLGSWHLVDVARLKRNKIQFAFWKVSCLKVTIPSTMLLMAVQTLNNYPKGREALSLLISLVISILQAQLCPWGHMYHALVPPSPPQGADSPRSLHSGYTLLTQSFGQLTTLVHLSTVLSIPYCFQKPGPHVPLTCKVLLP